MEKIIRARLDHLDDIVPLFDAYCVFYKQASNPHGVRNFLKSRLENNDSVIFIIYQNEKAVGFTQLYPVFSSSTLQAMYILNDLYVDLAFRKKGIGKSLLDAAKEFAIMHNLKGLSLETGINNPAQKLYEREGWVRDEAYYHYFWKNE